MPKLTLDCSAIPSGRIKVSLQSNETLPSPIEIEAFRCVDEQFITKVSGVSPNRESDPGRIPASSRPFLLEYEISSRFPSFMGSHLNWNLNYPFFNPEEAYLGSGLLPVMTGYEQTEESLWYDLEITNVPDRWEICTSLLKENYRTGRIPMEKAAQFFFYASCSAKTYCQGQTHLTISEKAALPVSPENIFVFCEKSIQAHEQVFGPNNYARTSTILILQSPANFDEITGKKTFSTGENYTGGIALYGPDREDVFRKLGHPSYLDFLLGGLHHEIGHAYTSAGPARFKSLLYASSTCPREDRILLGENLNGYFNGAVRATFDTQYDFSLKSLIPKLLSQLGAKKRFFSLDLLLFDFALRENKISLYQVFQEMLREKRQSPGPFSSAEFLIHSAERLIGSKLDPKTSALLLAPEPTTYQERLNAAIDSQGWRLDSLPEDRKSSVNFFLA